MKARTVALLGLVVPATAVLLFFWTSPPHPLRTSQGMAPVAGDRVNLSSPSSTKEPSAPPSVPAPNKPRPVPSKTEPNDDRAPTEEFEQPDSPEQYWVELEELERTDKQQALQYALLGDEWYEDEGKPAEARRAKIVTLLVDLGRMQEARERTRRFIEQYPQSPYRRLVQGVTGIHPRPGKPPEH